MCDVPVLLITFNRPRYAEIQLDALRVVKPKSIYFASDAPRTGNSEDIELVEETREYYHKNIDWDCKLKTNFRTNNLGCSEGPIEAMKWFFEHERDGIILEDDIIPHPDFFKFAGEMLERYRHNLKIISVSGCNLGYEGDANSYCFARIMNMWGWATWANRFKSIDFEITDWKAIRYPYLFFYNRFRQSLLDLDINWWKYWKEKFDLTMAFQSEVTWWDYQFIFNQIYNKQFSIYPNQNLIKNIGFDQDASHTIHEKDIRSNFDFGDISFPLTDPQEVCANRILEEEFIKLIWAEYKRPNMNYYLSKFFHH